MGRLLASVLVGEAVHSVALPTGHVWRGRLLWQECLRVGNIRLIILAFLTSESLDTVFVHPSDVVLDGFLDRDFNIIFFG